VQQARFNTTSLLLPEHAAQTRRQERDTDLGLGSWAKLTGCLVSGSTVCEGRGKGLVQGDAFLFFALPVSTWYVRWKAEKQD